MGLFDELDEDFTEIEEPALGLPPGTYEAMVSSVTTESKDSGTYVVFTYTVTEEGPLKGKSHKEFKKTVVGRAQNDKDREAIGYIKQRLRSLGVAPERMNTIDPDDLVGTEIALTLVNQRNNPDYRQVQKIVLLDASSDEAPVLPEPASSKTSSAKSDTSVDDMFS